MNALVYLLWRMRLALASLMEERTNLPAVYIPLKPEGSDFHDKS